MDWRKIEFEILLALQKESANLIDENLIKRGNWRNYKCRLKFCFRPALAKGLCNAHYIRKKKGQKLNFPIQNRKTSIKCIKCGEPTNNRSGFKRCKKHYRRDRLQLIKGTVVKLFGDKCSICGNRFPMCVYDFHHLKKKDAPVSCLMSMASIRKMAKEIAKCQLVCANCHRGIHNR